MSEAASCYPPQAQASAAQQLLANHRHPRSFSDVAEGNIAAAVFPWKDFLASCNTKPDPDAPITRLMDYLANTH